MKRTTLYDEGTHHVSLIAEHNEDDIHFDQTKETARRNPGVGQPECSAGPKSSMLEGHQADTHSDEVTPIRQAESHEGRNYNTEPAPPSSSRNTKADGKAKADSNGVGGVMETKEKVSWYKRMAEKYGSISLDNKGSVARDHLALERTFLAWLRTSLAFASIGIAVTQLFRLNTSVQSRSKSMTQMTGPSIAQSSRLPLSPLIGHGLPYEIIPLLQQLVLSAPSMPPTHDIVQAQWSRQTLLDQLLVGSSMVGVSASDVAWTAFDDSAATRLRHVGKPLGATFIGISIVVLFIGFHRYFEAQFWIIRGKFPASRGSVALTGLIAGALMVASLVVILVVAPTSYQKG